VASGLRVLITNNTLDRRAGTEVWTRDLAIGLLRRGYLPVAYSPVLGDVAEEMRWATVPVVNDLSAVVAPPDLIHGQHHLDAMCAMLRFPGVPAVYMCHGFLPWEETPPAFPSIRRYIAVDDLCRERLLTSPGIDGDRVRIVRNSVDLSCFRPRPPLAASPRAALIFSNIPAGPAFVEPIREACRRTGIAQVDVAGLGGNLPTSTPATLLAKYDVVFAKGRSALEALALGCAVIVAEFPGIGGIVTPENVSAFREWNFGLRLLQRAPVTVDAIVAELQKYDPHASCQVTRWIRDHASLDRALDEVEACYREALSDGVGSISAGALGEAASSYLATLAPVIKARQEAETRASQAEQAAVSLALERDALAQLRSRGLTKLLRRVRDRLRR
jgi:hypothetical protein